MGNRASTYANPDENKTTALPDDVEEEDAIVLDQGLQEMLVKDFQSKILREEWEERQRQILLQANDRESRDEKKRMDLEERYTKWKEANEAKHASLDEKINKLKSSFRDTEFALKYDLNALQEKMGSGPKYVENDNTCLDARVNLSKCFKTNTNFGACDEFVNIFEQCVKKVVIQKSAKQ